jgi:AbrB family looped-hinge helix DNA binding protein
METVTLSSKGQLVIPKGVRDDAHIVAGSRLQVQYLDGEIRLRPLPAQGTATLSEVAGCLAKPGRKRLTEAQTRAAIRTKLKARNTP